MRAMKHGDKPPGWKHTQSRDGERRRFLEVVKSKHSPIAIRADDADELRVAAGPNSGLDISVGSLVEIRG